MDLYFLKNFNNYFNRIVKRRDTLQEYLDEVGQDGYFLLANTNFVPNDGVSTLHVAGSSGNPFTPEWQPDYCLVVDDQNNIISRWYIIEFVRLMANQYRASFKRDTPVDKFIILQNASCYIEKAPLKNNDPFIVHSEGLSLNQIKKKEYFLRDKTKVPWIIVYMAQKRDEDWNDIESQYRATSSPSTLPVIEDDPTMRELFIRESLLITSIEKKQLMYQEEDNQIRFATDYHHATYDAVFGFRPGQIGQPQLLSNKIEFYYPKGSIPPEYQIAFDDNYYTDKAIGSSFQQEAGIDQNILVNHLMSQLGCNAKQGDIIPTIEDGKLWYSRTTNKVYIAHNTVNSITYEEASTGELDTYLRERATYLAQVRTRGHQVCQFLNPEKAFRIFGTIKKINFTLEENATDKIYGSIKKTTNHCRDVPYDIIALPLGEIDVYNGNTYLFTTLKDVALNFARAIFTEKTQQNIYDVQLLPYCPIQTGIVENGRLRVDLGAQDADYAFINTKKESESPTTIDRRGIMLFPLYATNYLTIDHVAESITADEEISISDVLKITERKIQNECELWRLCSPNYQGIFEFNLARMIDIRLGDSGAVTKFDVDITYRPYNPYIHIVPDFNFLYGEDFDDSRGLICGGDFSVTTISDAWKNYEVNNKNYQNMFNREMSSLEINRAISREQEQWAIFETGFGGMINMILGSMAGGIAGAIGGGGATGAVGAVTGFELGGINTLLRTKGAGKRAEWNERAYQEMRNFKTDMFKMQLDNIKAMPQSLTKSSTISANYKVFPFLEYYTCTDEEKTEVREKIRFNGMSVGRIDFIKNYLSDTEECFIKGQLIRLEELGEDSHMAQDLYDEVSKGLFFAPYTPFNKEK